VSYSQVSAEIGDRLKEARIKKLWKIKDAANAWGCAEPTWTNFEKGRKSFKPEDLFRFSSILGCDPSWLLTGKKEKATPNVASEIEVIHADQGEIPVIGRAAADDTEFTCSTFFQETLGNCRFGTGLAAVQVVGSNPTAVSMLKSLYSMINKGLQAFSLPLPKVEFVENIN